MKLENPSYLITGQPEETESFTYSIIKSFFCPNNCNACANCSKIKNKSHENIIWMHPDKKTYSKDQLDIIFEKCSFALEAGEKFFFVIPEADLLNAASANSLLKIVEEPPTGFHFFFLTNRAQDIIATIKSRCIVKSFASTGGIFNIELLQILTQDKIDPIKFLQALDKSNISEKESIALVEELIKFWATKAKSNNPKATLNIETLTKALAQPPMSGSSKVFWKNVVIQLSS